MALDGRYLMARIFTQETSIVSSLIICELGKADVDYQLLKKVPNNE